MRCEVVKKRPPMTRFDEESDDVEMAQQRLQDYVKNLQRMSGAEL